MQVSEQSGDVSNVAHTEEFKTFKVKVMLIMFFNVRGWVHAEFFP